LPPASRLRPTIGTAHHPPCFQPPSLPGRLAAPALPGLPTRTPRGS
jgi:hypothetical protein